MLGILLCFAAFLLTFPLHLCLYLVLRGKEKVEDLGRQGRYFIGQKLARPHIPASSVCLTHWLEMGLYLLAPLGPCKFTLFNFYRAVYGLQREEARGICCQGLHWAMNHHLGVLFLPALCESCKQAFRPSERDGKGLLGGKAWKSRRVMKGSSGTSETLVCL